MPFPVLKQGLVISTSELGCIDQAMVLGIQCRWVIGLRVPDLEHKDLGK